ncbi:hypothetical protein [Pontimicrobium sp. MEBiC01747]
MKKITYILLLLLFTCNNSNEKISLEEIKLDRIFNSSKCKDDLKYATIESFQTFINTLNKDYKQEFDKIILCEYFLQGETTNFNSFAVLLNDSETKIVSFGQKYDEVLKMKTVDNFSMKYFLEDLKFENVSTGMSVLEISKNDFNCFYREKFTYDIYTRLEDLSYFNNG